MVDLPHIVLPEHSYVIYDPNRDQYSRGGDGPNWSKKPKVWTTMGNLKNHLAMFIAIESLHVKDLNFYKHTYHIHRGNPYNVDCVVYDIVNKTQVATVHELFNQLIAARKKADEKHQKKVIAELTAKIRKMNGQEP